MRRPASTLRLRAVIASVLNDLEYPMPSTKLLKGAAAFFVAASAAANAEGNDLGRRTLAAVGCAGCHEIPGVGMTGADSGPPLHQIGSRVYLAGVLPNTRENLIRWITHPQEIHPGDAMPDTPLSDGEAGTVADYLQSLR